MTQCPLCHEAHELSSCPHWKVVPRKMTEEMLSTGLLTKTGVYAWDRADAEDFYKKLLAAAPAVPAPWASAWLPIETAPKTSRAILVWCPERKNTYQVNWYMERWEHFGGASRPLYEPPTHWMPLPPAPGAQAVPVVQLSEPPEGWKWVPIVPTDAMRDAGNVIVGSRSKLFAAWRQMLAAAPTTPKDAS